MATILMSSRPADAGVHSGRKGAVNDTRLRRSCILHYDTYDEGGIPRNGTGLIRSFTTCVFDAIAGNRHDHGCLSDWLIPPNIAMNSHLLIRLCSPCLRWVRDRCLGRPGKSGKCFWRLQGYRVPALPT